MKAKSSKNAAAIKPIQKFIKSHAQTTVSSIVIYSNGVTFKYSDKLDNVKFIFLLDKERTYLENLSTMDSADQNLLKNIEFVENKFMEYSSL